MVKIKSQNFPCFDAQLDLIQLEQHLKGKSVKACLFSTLDLYKDCLRINIGWAITDIPKSNTANNPNSEGKKLGFIGQEMGREINTLGSKANNADLQKIVVQMKDELEKIKEQVLNIL